MSKIEWHDVQGLVLNSYQELPYAAYVLWHFVSTDGAAEAKPGTGAKDWLKRLIPHVARVDAVGEDDEGPGQPSRPRVLKSVKSLKQLEAAKEDGDVEVSAINIALTSSGLAWLGVPDAELSLFSAEFCEGMAPKPVSKDVSPRRTNLLGDHGKNAPSCWDWGGWHSDRIDGVLLLYSSKPESLKSLIDHEIEAMKPVAAPLLDSAGRPRVLYGRVWKDDLKEHFGFRDGISQPVIADTKRAKKLEKENPKEARVSIVKPGEILLGYPNERGVAVNYSSGSTASESSRDLARNGTYMVFRQLEQDVALFRKEVAKTAMHLRGSDSQEDRDWVAARMVGRKLNGEPLIPAAADSVVLGEERNDFLYHFEDKFGLHCPLGAHVRRANPRDLIGPTPESALRLSKMHRIIRRGRPYGERLPADSGDETSDAKDMSRGMMFIALNADIAGQFEMIQHTWINNGRFSGLYDEMDPLVHFPGEKRVMTIQRRPTCMPVDDLQQFVTVRGGAYFFMPGIRALESLAQ